MTKYGNFDFARYKTVTNLNLKQPEAQHNLLMMTTR